MNGDHTGSWWPINPGTNQQNLSDSRNRSFRDARRQSDNHEEMHRPVRRNHPSSRNRGTASWTSSNERLISDPSCGYPTSSGGAYIPTFTAENHPATYETAPILGYYAGSSDMALQRTVPNAFSTRPWQSTLEMDRRESAPSQPVRLQLTRGWPHSVITPTGSSLNSQAFPSIAPNNIPRTPWRPFPVDYSRELAASQQTSVSQLPGRIPYFADYCRAMAASQRFEQQPLGTGPGSGNGFSNSSLNPEAVPFSMSPGTRPHTLQSARPVPPRPRSYALSSPNGATSVAGGRPPRGRPKGLGSTPADRSSTNDRQTAPQRRTNAPSGYFGGDAPASTSVTALNTQFDRYRDDPKNEPNLIKIEGAQKYLSDLRLSPDQFEVLVLQTVLGCPSLATFERQRFTAGWSHHSATTASQQASTLSNLTKTITTTTASSALAPSVLGATGTPNSANETLFKRVYRHTFVLALPSDSPNVRSVPLEAATEFWRLLLGPNSPAFKWVGSTRKTPWLEWWLSFLQKSGKSVSKDLWLQTLSFAEKTRDDEDLSFWTEDSAWPGMMDEFVAWVKEKQNSDGVMDMT